MELKVTERYKYEALDNTTDSDTRTRLFLLESKPNEKQIRGSLRVVDLANEPDYDCLSYTWSDPFYHELSSDKATKLTDAKLIKPIICDGKKLLVTESLSAALSQLSMNTASRKPLWIDAICINQDDVKERNHQVQFMFEIYSGAKRVIIWLGGSDEHTDSALKVMNALKSVEGSRRHVTLSCGIYDDPCPELGIEFIEAEEWLDYAAFLQRTWYSRIWIVQETFAAREIKVLCGNHELSWEDMTSNAQLLQRTGLRDKLVTLESDALIGESGETRYVGSRINNQFILATMKERKRTLGIEQLCKYTRYFQATNKKDLIYALLGIWKQSPVYHKAPQVIKPDYSKDKSVDEVFTDASWAIIRENGDLHILSLVEGSAFKDKQLNKLPSWVPDFSTLPKIKPLIADSGDEEPKQRWNASSGLAFDTPEQIDPLLLPAKGFSVDKIVECGPTYFEILEKHEMQRLFKLISHIPPKYPNGEPSAEAFWRTIIKDTFDDRPADDEAREAWKVLIVRWFLELRISLTQIEEQLEWDTDSTVTLQKRGEELKQAHSELEGGFKCPSDNQHERIMPSWDEIERINNILQDVDNDEDQDLMKTTELIDRSFTTAYAGRRLFRTQQGYVGIVAESLQEGDSVWILAGAAVPMVLRLQQSGKLKFVGEAYVHGIMNGEIIDKGNSKLETICLE